MPAINRGGGQILGDDGIVLYVGHDDGCMLHMFIKFWDWHTKGEFYTMRVIFIFKFKNNKFKSRVLTYLKIMLRPHPAPTAYWSLSVFLTISVHVTLMGTNPNMLL